MGTGRGTGLDFGHTAGMTLLHAILPETIHEQDFMIGRSVGARALNYNIKDPRTKRIYHFVEGTSITDVEVFAGKGVRSKLSKRVVEGLTRRYGGKMRNWQHAKGVGTIKRGNKWQTAEVHWFQEPSVGKCEFKIKRWL